MRPMLTFLLIMFLLSFFGLSSPRATTYFNPVPVPLVQGNPGDTCASNPAACAKASDLNTDFNSLVTDGNAAKASIETSLAGISSVGLPSGAVIAVNLPACPTGFVIANGSGGSPDARGVYIRGLDNGAGHDPGRALASFQDDALQDHVHGAPPVQQNTNNASAPAGGFSIINFFPTATPGTNAQAGGESETSPVTVVLLYCFKT